jgi:hypothetical protein
MWRRVALVGTDISEERIAYITRVKWISELGTMLLVTSTLILEEKSSCETSVLKSATRRHTPEDRIFYFLIFSPLLKSWVTQNFITIKISWNTND